MRTIDKILTASALGLIIAGPRPAMAGEYCWNEYVQYVILQGNVVYFTTSKSCPSWCTLHPNWTVDRQKQAYAMLLTAKTTDKPLALYWEEHSSACAGSVPVGAYPHAMVLQ